MKILRTEDVLDRLGIGRTTLYEWRRAGTFPEPKQLGPQAIGWTESQLEEWWESRPAARPAAPAAAGADAGGNGE